MSLSSVLTAPDPAARTALAESLARVGGADHAGAASAGSDLAAEPLPAAVPSPPSCRAPVPAPGEATWRRRLRVARSWWCAFVSGLG